MNKDNAPQARQKKKLVLRKESIKALDQEELSVIAGGFAIAGNPLPPDGGVPPKTP